MIKLRQAKEKNKNGGTNATANCQVKHRLIRDQLLTKEIADITNHVHSAQLRFPDPDKLYEFTILVSPDEGMWKGGIFKFTVFVPEEYNMKPPIVRSLTPVWHPNISLDGAVCLSILRDHSLDGSGWSPTRTIKDIIWGLNSLFTDLVDFDDALNNEAADEFRRDRKSFQRRVDSYLCRYAR